MTDIPRRVIRATKPAAAPAAPTLLPIVRKVRTPPADPDAALAAIAAAEEAKAPKPKKKKEKYIPPEPSQPRKNARDFMALGPGKTCGRFGVFVGCSSQPLKMHVSHETREGAELAAQEMAADAALMEGRHASFFVVEVLSRITLTGEPGGIMQRLTREEKQA